jgi:prepilin-type N-terminal cleavage/methylation domain-containing protein
MASLKTYTANRLLKMNTQRGFSLIETLIVISIIGMIAGATLFFDITNFRGAAFHTEVANLVTALQTARADALNNVNQKKHGVAINPGSVEGYVMFEGDDYAHRDITKDNVIPSMYRITVASSSPTEIVFAQLSGVTSFNGDVSLIDPERNASTSIAINFEGRISW